MFETLQDIARDHSSTTDWYIDLLICHMHMAHFPTRDMPDWLHIWCVGILLVNSGPWVMEFSMPSVWNDPHFNIRARFLRLRGLIFT